MKRIGQWKWMGKQGTEEESLDLLASIKLTRKQRMLFWLFKGRGVCIQMTKEAKENEELQELIVLLRDMHEKGIIPSFQVVEV